MRIVISIILSIYTLTSCQSKKTAHFDYNLSFEKAERDTVISWRSHNRSDSSKYAAFLDSTTVKKGRYAAAILYTGGKPGFSTWVQSIPKYFPGDSITLSGYIKTENVTDGYAGLWMRIDPGLAFDNMHDRGATGTTDWTQYTVTLPLNSKKYEKIAFGGMLVGKGKMWIDALKITIDGKDISALQPIDRLPAEKDHQFDKGSSIVFGDLDSNKINTLYETGLLWGFLKYYHPAIIEGKYNWDYELFRVLPHILSASTDPQKNNLFYKWIDTLGSLKSTNITFNTLDTHLVGCTVTNPDLEWITHSGFNIYTQAILQKIKDTKRTATKQYYVSIEQDSDKALFENEEPYPDMSYPDAGFRLLALYRYWNIIQYFFPYRDQIGEDWKITLKKFIPKFLNAKNELEYNLCIMELAGQIHDSHAFVKNGKTVYKFFGNRYLPIKLRFIDEKPVVIKIHNVAWSKISGQKDEFTTRTENNDWQKGDVITKINNIPVKELIEKLALYTPASNRWTQLRDIAWKLIRTNDTTLQIEIVRNGKKINKTVNSYQYDQLQITDKFSIAKRPYKWISDKVGYINNGALKESDLSKAFDQFKNAEGIIIDMRNYPSGYLVFELPRYLLSEPTPFLKFLVPQLNNPGTFSFTNLIETRYYKKNPYRGKIALLIDETTQSSAEYHTMAYQVYPNCIIVGSHSAGADGNISEIILPGNIKTNYSGVGIYYPDGTPTQRVGIKPDVIVRPTISGIANGKDEVLDKAIQLLRQ